MFIASIGSYNTKNQYSYENKFRKKMNLQHDKHNITYNKKINIR